MLLNEPWYLSVSLFERALACINLAAFLSSLVQWRGQIGSTGILPARDIIQYYKRREWTFANRPTLCLIISDSDVFLATIHYVGILCSLMAFFAIIPPGICFIGCWLCYASLVLVSTTFMGLQMHSNLLETDLLYILCSPFLAAQPQVFVFIQWTLLFRIMLGGAVGKVSRRRSIIRTRNPSDRSIQGAIIAGKMARQCSGIIGRSKEHALDLPTHIFVLSSLSLPFG